MNWHGTEVHVHRIGRTARAGSSGGDRFLRAGRGAAGKYSFEMLQLKLNWLNAPARQSLLHSGRRDGYPNNDDGGKKRKCVREIFLGADRRY